MPERLLGDGALRIQDAARQEGFDWNPLPKFIDPELCDGSCPKCMIGCAKGAKWTARSYVEEALAAGAKLRTRAKVEEVLYSGGRVSGVRGSGPSGPFEVEAETVVLAAGGIGTAVIMQASGFADAGRGFFIDPLQLTTAISPWQGSSHDIPMTCGTTDLVDEGIIMTDVIHPWPLYFFGLVMGDRVTRSTRSISAHVEHHDQGPDPLTGSISADGKVSKPFGEKEQALLRRGRRSRPGSCAAPAATRRPSSWRLPEVPIRAAPCASARCWTIPSDLRGRTLRMRRQRHPRAQRLAPVLTIVSLARDSYSVGAAGRGRGGLLGIVGGKQA